MYAVLLLLLLESARAVSGTVVGIDLGTTSSAIALVDGASPRLLAFDDGRSTLPSLVSYDADNRVAVGRAADAATALASTKRLIGRTYDEVDATLPRRCELRDALARLPDGGAGVLCCTTGRIVSPEEVATHIISALLDAAEESCGTRAERAVIGVPAHFLAAQRDATKRAAAAAGLDKVRLIEEPVAAALAYGVLAPDRGDELVCVYDLGGGTHDVSILQVGGGTIEVLGSAGEAWLGGDDFDAQLAAYIAKKAGLPAASGSDSEIVRIARRAKEALTVRRRVELPLSAPAPRVSSVEDDGNQDGGFGRDGIDSSMLGQSVEDFLAAHEGEDSSGDGSSAAGSDDGNDDDDMAEGEEVVESLSPSEIERLLDAEGSQGVWEVDHDLLPAERERLLDEGLGGVEEQGGPEEAEMLSLHRIEMVDACSGLLERLKGPLMTVAASCQLPLRETRSMERGRRRPSSRGPSAARPSNRGRRIDRVLLAGAASRMPSISDLVTELTGVRPDTSGGKPETVVALGAAVQAGVLEGSLEQLDVLSTLDAALIRGLARGKSSRQGRAKKRR